MVRRWVARSLVGLSCLGTAACNTNTSGPSGTAGANAAVKPVNPDEFGDKLFKADSPEVIPPFSGIEEPIVVPNAVVRLDKKQTVPAQLDGYLMAIGSPLPPGATFDKNDRDITFHQIDLTKKDKDPIRRIREGDRVQVGQLVAVFDDIEAAVQIQSSQLMIQASDEAIAAAKKGEGFIREQLVQMEKFKEASSRAELLNTQATLSRYEENRIQSEREKVRAEGDWKRGWAIHAKHHARSMVNGIVTKVMRSPGEFLKAGEPVMEILATDEQQVEGNIDAKDAWAVVPGMKVTVEPSTPVGPDTKIGSLDHRLEVTGVVVTSHPGRPLVVSGSLDGTVGVWGLFPPADRQRAQLRLQNGAPVRAVACTGAKADRHWIATGGDDGKVRVWDVGLPAKPTREGSEAHSSAVTALAFSPDGKYLVSAAGRDVWVWDVGDGKKLYALPGEHKDAVTAVRFTPQATLVTVARDRAIRVWDVRKQGAVVARTIDHRKGNVEHLGMSKEGGRILFDQDDGRIDVVSLADGRPVGSIQNAAASARFATLAVFSADDSLVLTASAGGDAQGELQLWKAPQVGGRGSEWRRLVTPGRAAPTCAAFSPDDQRKFMVVGTQAGRVHVWTRGSNEEMAKGVRTGRVTSVLRLDPKTVKVRVETETRPGEVVDLLQDKGSATIIIQPGDAGLAPKAAAPLPPLPGGVIQAAATGDLVGLPGVLPMPAVTAPIYVPQVGPTAANAKVTTVAPGLLPTRLLTAPTPRPADQK